MPPKDKKQAVSQPSKPQIRRQKAKSSSSSSPPATRKRRAATILEARAHKLQKEKSIALGSKTIQISNSSSSSKDPMTFTTDSSSSSSFNEDNMLDKLDKKAKMAEELEAIAQKRDAFWAARARGESGAHVFGHGKDTKQQEQLPEMVTQEQPAKPDQAPLPIPEPQQPAPPSQSTAPNSTIPDNSWYEDLNFKINFMVQSLACIESRLDVLFERHDTLSAQIALLTPTPQEQAPQPPT